MSSVTLSVQPLWDAAIQTISLNPSLLQLPATSSTDAKNARARLRICLQQDPMRSVLLSFTTDSSLPASMLLVPHRHCVALGLSQGDQVRVQLEERSASSLGRPAVTVHGQMWKPGNTLDWIAALPTPTPNGSLFQSSPLAALMHDQLLFQIARSNCNELRLIRWQGMNCLARITKVTTWKSTNVEESKQGAVGAAANENADEDYEEEEVESALVDEDTEFECEVLPGNPAFTNIDAAVEAIAAGVTALSVQSTLPLYPHMQTVIGDASINCASSFPKEWKEIHRFVHHAIQARWSALLASRPVASDSVQPVGHMSLQLGVSHALLLSGINGVGKSTLIDAFLASLLPNQFLVKRLTGMNLLTQLDETSRTQTILQLHSDLLQQLEKQNSANATSASGILILEDMDEIMCSDAHSDLSTQLLTLLDRLHASPSTSSSSSTQSPLVVLMVSISQHARLPAHFLSSSRFGAEIRFGLSDKTQRRKILLHQLGSITKNIKNNSKVEFQLKSMPDPSSHSSGAFQNSFVADEKSASSSQSVVSNDPLDRLAQVLSEYTPGYIANDLRKLVQYSVLCAASRWDDQSTSGASLNSSYPPAVEWSDFQFGLKHTHPSHASSATASLQLANTASSGASSGSEAASSSALSKHSWPKIAGYELIKKRLDLTLYHWLNPARIQVLGLKPISGVLFHGASGTGKSLFAHSLASHGGLNFLSLSVASIYSQYLGESEARIRAIFRSAAQLAPCVLLLDQIESIAGKRDGVSASEGAGTGVDARVLSTLLNEMDGVSRAKGVYVVACTTEPSALDSALLRPGRFDDVIEIPFPNRQDRLALFQHYLRGVNVDSEIDLEALSTASVGLTGADIKEMISKAGMMVLRESMSKSDFTLRIQQTHLVQALTDITGNPVV